MFLCLLLLLLLSFYLCVYIKKKSPQMENSVKQKSLKCIEWVVNAQSYELRSESFSFQDVQCNFEFALGRNNGNGYGYSASHLYLRSKSGSVFQSRVPVKVTIHITLNSNNLASQTSAIASFTQPIWTCSSGNLQGKLLAVDMIIHNDSSKKNPPEATIVASWPQVVPESQKGSNSSKTVHLEALCRDISELSTESFSCDVEIKCEGETFKAHRIILGARSSVFWTMLKNNMIESETGFIEVEDIKAPIFKSFLRYLYSGTLPEINMDTAMQFYEAGDKYAVEELQKACSEFLTDNLSESNACDVLVLADQHNDEEFRKSVISYIVDKKIPQRDKQWPTFCRKYQCLAVEVQNLYIQKYIPE